MNINLEHTRLEIITIQAVNGTLYKEALSEAFALAIKTGMDVELIFDDEVHHIDPANLHELVEIRPLITGPSQKIHPVDVESLDAGLRLLNIKLDTKLLSTIIKVGRVIMSKGPEASLRDIAKIAAEEGRKPANMEGYD